MKRLFFGMQCDPRVATLALRQAAKDFGHLNLVDVVEYVASSAHVMDFLSDFLSTFSIISEGKRVVWQLTDLLKPVGFESSEWQNKDKNILSDVTEGDLSLKRYRRGIGVRQIGTMTMIYWVADFETSTKSQPGEPYFRTLQGFIQITYRLESRHQLKLV